MSWDAINQALAAAHAEIAAAAPDAATAAEGEAYVARMLTSCLNDAFLGHLLTENGLTRALPTRGGPNPDYIMRHAPIDAAKHYRLEGCLNASERVGVGLYSIGAGGGLDIAGYAAFDASNTDADDRFTLDLSADAQGPNALAIPANARVLAIRVLHRNAQGATAHLNLIGAAPVTDLTLANGSTDAALARAAQAMLTGVRQFLEWSAAMSASPNQFLSEAPRLTQGVQGDPDTIYYLGYYALGAGEWLEIELPAGLSGYWSLYAYNHWCEALPGAGVHDRNAVSEPDGAVRIALGPAAPHGARNIIDTRGRLRGALIFRTIGAQSIAPPKTSLRRN